MYGGIEAITASVQKHFGHTWALTLILHMHMIKLWPVLEFS
jgi:hypothetical protein